MCLARRRLRRTATGPEDPAETHPLDDPAQQPHLRVQGSADARFAPVRERFAAALADGSELGAAVAVVCAGELVVDLWGGLADETAGMPWSERTLVNLFSVTKGLTALCMLQALERGALTLEAPLARYWPACSGDGREAITVEQALSHRAGMIGFRAAERIDPELILDFDAFASRLVQEAPFWEPGSRHGYHARTFGHLLGAPLLGVTGRGIGGWLREEIAGPLALDLHIGLPESEHDRCARLAPARVRPPLPEPVATLLGAMADPDSFTGAAFGNPATPRGQSNSAAFRSAEIPALNGHGTARDLARVHGDLASPRPSLLSAEWREEAVGVRSDGDDPVLLRPTRFGLGFMLAREDLPLGGGPRAFGHPGAGGALAWSDPDCELGFAFVVNRLQPGVVAGSDLARELGALARACATGGAA